MNRTPAVEVQSTPVSAEHADCRDHTEQANRTTHSEGALRRVWENGQDAVYDDWEKLHDVSTRNR
jgi:hypothetical protein